MIEMTGITRTQPMRTPVLPTSQALSQNGDVAMRDVATQPQVSSAMESVSKAITAAKESAAAVTATETASFNEAIQQVRENVQAAIQDRMSNNRISFSVDADKGMIIVKVIDAETEEVVRQIPPEELLRIAESLDTANLSPQKGVLFDQEG
ncbi:flagellar protein FlaG [Candidatus Sumerlaeota bacterium]|nr:flagellar protein FlaG [Candidatus Sumerlaeota bacterium]